MLIQQITPDELEFCECFYDSVAMTECCFSDLDNLLLYNENFAELRLGQFPLLSYEYILDTEQPELDKKENFKLKEGAGSIYCFGGRRFGKTLLVEQVDILISMFLLDGEHVGFSSIDALHIRGVVEKIVTIIRTHKLFQVLSAQINRSPNYRISLPSGYLFETINMNLSGQSPGNAFFQKHMHRLYIEEAGFESEEVYNKRIDAVSEDGCVYRLAGMTNFTKYSPAGRAFYERTNQSKVCNLPQLINPKWDDIEKEKAIREYGGEQSVGYRVFVNGEVVEDGISVMDMDRVRKQYLQDKQVKTFEITKENFSGHKEILVLERPSNANKVYVCADIGETAPTEVIIICEVNESYYYTHNIVAYRLDDKQQFELIKYIVSTLGANVIGIDSTDGTGRAIVRQLSEVFSRDNIIACSFNEKVPVDFEKDDKGRVIFDMGKPKMKEEYVSEWTVRRLKALLYEGKLWVPSDNKFDIQLNSLVATMTGSRTVYSVMSSEDHLFAAFRVFALAEWRMSHLNPSSMRTKKIDKCGC